jgi:hypothetical protein
MFIMCMFSKKLFSWRQASAYSLGDPSIRLLIGPSISSILALESCLVVFYLHVWVSSFSVDSSRSSGWRVREGSMFLWVGNVDWVGGDRNSPFLSWYWLIVWNCCSKFWISRALWNFRSLNVVSRFRGFLYCEEFFGSRFTWWLEWVLYVLGVS